MSKTAHLLISTTTVSGVIGIAQDGNVVSEVPLELATASNRVVVAIDKALAEAGCQVEEISRIVLVKGPGTFTGSRIGASIAKAISYALPCTLASVTTLEAVAWTGMQASISMNAREPVWALLDARRHQFYAQEFILCDGMIESQGEGVCLGPEIFDTARRSGGLVACAFPLSAVPETERPRQDQEALWKFNAYPTCRGIIAAAVNALPEDPFTLEPVYLRTTEELFDRPKAVL